METFVGNISKDKTGNPRTFEFEVADDATDEEIEKAAKGAAWLAFNFAPICSTDT